MKNLELELAIDYAKNYNFKTGHILAIARLKGQNYAMSYYRSNTSQ